MRPTNSYFSVRTQWTRAMLLLTILTVTSILASSPSENDSKYLELIEEYGEASISEAKKAIHEETLSRTIRGVQTNARRTYVKYTLETEEIGRESNINLRAYEILRTRYGIPKQFALNYLTNRRPAACTRQYVCNHFTRYRSIDGTCNNLRNPLWGASFTAFHRLLPNAYEDGFAEQRGGQSASRLPNARLVSTTIHPDLIKPDPIFTNMVGQFGQFVDHDLTLTPEGDRRCCTTQGNDVDCWPIRVFQNDSFYSSRTVPQTCMDFTRSTTYCFPTRSGIREQMNILTAYADASNVYASEPKRGDQLRAFAGGRLRVNSENEFLLPTVEEVEKHYGIKIEYMGKFLAGDERVNEMPALAVLHTLFVREHNRIADQIQNLRPNWQDSRVFEEARRLLIAQWQNILFSEYLPIILGPQTMQQYSLTVGEGYSTYNPNMDASVFHAFATAAYRFGHTLINGIIQLLKGLAPHGSYRLRDNFFRHEQLVANGGEGYSRILEGLVNQPAQAYDPFVTEDLTNFLLREPHHDFGGDLLARNVQRGRDHGIPPYDDFRALCGFPRLPTSFKSAPPEEPKLVPGTWEKLATLYNNPRDIDLFTGGITEIGVEGGLSGPTFNCLKARQFQRTKFGDRFFFTHANQVGSFTPSQLAHIRRRKLSDIICDNSDLDTISIDVFRRDSAPGNERISCRPEASSGKRTVLNVTIFLN